MDTKPIEHVIVLMMCGRSFDHMFGGLRALDSRIEGLTGTEANPDSTGEQVRVQPLAVYQGLSLAPESAFQSVNRQIFGAPSQLQETMGGFVKDYFEQRRDVAASRRVMHYFAPAKLPALLRQDSTTWLA